MKLEDIFEPEIMRRGREYYREGRVKYVVKDGDILSALVAGSYDYKVEIDLGRRNADCNCPYDGGPCKHAAAVLKAYENNEYLDGEKVRSTLENMDKKELVEIAYKHAIKDPEYLKSLLLKKDKKTKKKYPGRYDEFFKEIKRGDLSYEGMIREVSSVSDEDKETILSFLEKSN